MARQISNEELKAQIAVEGEHWGLFPMETIFGEVVVGESIPMTIPLGWFSVVEDVERDITSISTEYQFSDLLRSRFGRSKREMYLARELAQQMKKKDELRPVEDAKEEFLKEFESGIIRGKVTTGGYRGANASTGTRYGRVLSRRTRR
jgi:hypothetical protein